MRLHRYKAADPHRLRLVVNRYPGEWPIGVALQRRQRVWSLVWRGPASMSFEKRHAKCPCHRIADELTREAEDLGLYDDPSVIDGTSDE